MYIIQTDYLQHHGILGQKWGVRRFQNPDGSLTEAGKIRARKAGQYEKSDFVIKKGSTLDHLSGKDNVKLRGNRNGAIVGTNAVAVALAPLSFGMTLTSLRNSRRSMDEKKLFVYDDTDDHDRDVYEGAFSKFVIEKSFYENYNNGKPGEAINDIIKKTGVYKYKLTAINDIVSPSDEKRAEIFVDTYRKNEKLFSDHLKKIDDHVQNSNLTSLIKDKSGKIADYKNVSDDDLKKYAYTMFNVANEFKDPASRKMNSKYYKEVQKQGYNAIIDDNNKRIYNGANNPLIVFNAKKNLKISSIEKLPKEQMDAAEKRLRKYMKKTTGSDSISI